MRLLLSEAYSFYTVAATAASESQSKLVQLRQCFPRSLLLNSNEHQGHLCRTYEHNVGCHNWDLCLADDCLTAPFDSDVCRIYCRLPPAWCPTLTLHQPHSTPLPFPFGLVPCPPNPPPDTPQCHASVSVALPHMNLLCHSLIDAS